MSFWQKLKKPIFILAPMDGVTDTVFRQIIVSAGKPDALFTEFTSVDGLLSKGKEKVLKRLQFSNCERPIVAQIWGSDPEKFYKAAQLISRLNFDGIDINMGCPDSSTLKKGACSALIKNPKLAKEIIKATVKGAGSLPVSVKTRIGFDKIETDPWVKTLLSEPIAVLTLHLRTVLEMSKVSAHWEEIKKAVEIRNQISPNTKIIGNGDVKSISEAKDKCEEYKIDGIMIGTGIFENVWLFNEEIDPQKITPKQKIDLLLKHLNLFQKTYQDNRHFELMKKFVKCYVNNFKRAAEVREKLMRTRTLEELIKTTMVILNLPCLPVGRIQDPYNIDSVSSTE